MKLGKPMVLIILLLVSFVYAVPQSHPTSQLATNGDERNSDLNLGNNDIILDEIRPYDTSFDNVLSLLGLRSKLYGLELGDGGFICSFCVNTGDIANSAVNDAKISDVAAGKISGTVSVSQGGTGSSTASGARTNLDVAKTGSCSGSNDYIHSIGTSGVSCRQDIDTIHHDHWSLQANGGTSISVENGNVVNFAGSGATGVSRSDRTITISSTDNDHHDNPASHAATGNINVNGHSLDSVDTITFENGKNLEYVSTYIRSNGQLLATRLWSEGDVIAEGDLTVFGSGSVVGGLDADYFDVGPGLTLTNDGNGFIVSSGGFKTASGKAVIAGGNSRINGNLDVTGTLSKGSGSFVIDHPLDPQNKLLRHSFVESPDMLNIYKGRARLNDGVAVVILPDYFERLNDPNSIEFSLTPVGGWSPLYVDGGVVDNTFLVKTTEFGNSSQEFSWIVYTVRADPYAKKHPIVVEEEKTDSTLVKKGEYLHPDAYLGIR